MKKPESIMRLFTISDDEMLQQSEVKRLLFIEHKTLFVSRFPALADPYADRWQTAYTAARAILPDYASVANQSDATKGLEALMENGHNLYQTLVLYVKLAFPKDANMLKLIGQPKYKTARSSQTKFPELLQMAYAQASKPDVKTALIAKGMKETEINQLLTTADAIAGKNIAQESTKLGRSENAAQRILAMNAVWEKMALVCQCAKLVFQNDALLYKQFLISGGIEKKQQDDTTAATPEK